MSRKTRPNSLSRIAIAAVAISLCVFAWQTWADSGKTALSASASKTPADNLMNVTTPDSIPQVNKRYTGFNMSFNPRMHIPNWVAWELTAPETYGEVKRSSKFASDESVSGSADPWDYNYSGYDRGHMCPAADMKWSAEAMHDCFFMTNMCPQQKQFNSGTWAKLEAKCRQWARNDSAIIIVCGPVLTDPITETIGDTHVAVPKRFFKVVLSPHAKPAARGIGFIFNNGSNPGGMQQCAVTIDEVERVTGLDFFAALPDDIETMVESQCDFPSWPRH